MSRDESLILFMSGPVAPRCTATRFNDPIIFMIFFLYIDLSIKLIAWALALSMFTAGVSVDMSRRKVNSIHSLHITNSLIHSDFKTPLRTGRSHGVVDAHEDCIKVCQIGDVYSSGMSRKR